MARAHAHPSPVIALEIDLWLKLAAQHRRAGELGKALSLYRKVLARQPTHPAALLEMGLAALETGASDVALALTTQAVAAAPRSAAANAALGRAHAAAGAPDAAIAAFRKALRFAQPDAGLLVMLGDAQLDANDRDGALKSYRLALKTQPDHPRALHMATALEGSDPGARNAYVSALFDGYAESFEGHLVAGLAYDAPARLRALVEEVAPERHFEAALDLGCGTGLMATAFLGKVAEIDGVDIAPKMVAAARAKRLYRQLFVADLAEWLERPESAAAYDLVLAGDVFIYVGVLDGVFASVAATLRPGGLFAFSLEEQAGSDVTIRSSGRFAHSEPYIARLAADKGFAVAASAPTNLRTENGRPIAGRLFVLALT